MRDGGGVMVVALAIVGAQCHELPNRGTAATDQRVDHIPVVVEPHLVHANRHVLGRVVQATKHGLHLRDGGVACCIDVWSA